jgi:hypothetical protein
MTFDPDRRGWFGTIAGREAAIVIGFAVAILAWAALTHNLHTANDILLIMHGLASIVFLGGLVRSAWKR